jgi:hypothetical protein
MLKSPGSYANSKHVPHESSLFKFVRNFYKLVHRICAAVNKKESIYPFWKCHRKLYDSVLLVRGHGELVEPLMGDFDFNISIYRFIIKLINGHA